MSQNSSLKPQSNDEEMRPEYDFSKGLRGVYAYRFSKLSTDEALVHGYWQKEGFEVSGFAKKEMRDQKAPDFLLMRNGVEVACCEVKSFQKDDWLEEQTKKALDSEIVGGARPDPIFNRICNAIHTAFKQFESVNSEHRLMNFLFLVNHDTSARPEDLDRVLTGYESPRAGILDSTCSQFSQGRIRTEKGRIDLYVWLDLGRNGEILSREYRVLGNPESRPWVCALLGIEPSRIRMIPTAA